MSSRILICDDEPHIALAVSMKFRNAGFDVQTARDGLEGWRTVQDQAPDLLITDCTMPHMDGLELCRRVRTLPRLHDLPIFLLTASSPRTTFPVSRTSPISGTFQKRAPGSLPCR